MLIARVTNIFVQGISLLRKMKDAIPEQAEHTWEFQQLTETLPADAIASWTGMVERWEEDNKLQNPFNPTVKSKDSYLCTPLPHADVTCYDSTNTSRRTARFGRKRGPRHHLGYIANAARYYIPGAADFDWARSRRTTVCLINYYPAAA